MDVVIIEVLNLVSFEKNPQPPNYPQEAIKELFEHVAKSLSLDVVDLLYKSR